ncbi:MFS transporter [Alicyclobacillus sp. SO9]|uniref:MFS transporter n=1 Tax=Alicyclobacillus sp. SO9 TaxID=2665646 RepID=UPI0018E76606|nr:MFS transporter [Alicyclobacillus sp. SO9]QQE77118.1 MFS transporter [Alicyclobacillus sp. SO9]
MQIRHEGLSIFIRSKFFRNLWLGSVISGLGNELGEAAVLWMVLDKTNSPAAVGLISLCVGVPRALVNPFAGVLGDRYSRPRLMVLGNLLLSLIYGGIAVTSYSGVHSIWISFVLLALGSVVSPLTSTGRSQLIAELISREERSAANFFDDVYLHLTWLVGPAIAGFSVSWLGYGPVLVIDSLSFVLCAAFLFSIPSALHTPGTPFSQLSKNLLDGVKMLKERSLLLQLAGLTFFFNFFFGVYAVFLPLMARNHFGGARAYGVLWSAFAIGSFVGGIIFSRKAWIWPIGPSMAAVIVFWGILTGLLAFAHQYWMVLVIMLVNGFVYTPYEPLYKTVIQHIIPIRMQAKVSSTIRPITGLGQPAGSWLSGLLATPLGITGLTFVSGVATVVVGAFTLMSPHIRSYKGGGADSLM